MTLLNPLALTLGVTLPVVIAFYLLKVRRHDEEVSSVFLWCDLVRHLAAHEPLQRLRWNVLLLLQLLALALGTLAVARPAQEQLGPTPIQAILLLDASASMQAQDVQPSRFARAVDAARATLASLPDHSQVTAILVADHPQVLVAATADRQRVDRALTSAQPSGAAENMREALLLARSVGGDPTARRIYLFTDAAFTLPTDLPEDLGSVEVTNVGANTGNLAVTAIATRPDLQDARRQQVFARVQNFSDASAQGGISLSVDGQTIEDRSVAFGPNGQSEQVFEHLPAGARWASVTIAAVRGTNSLSLDDAASAVLTQRPSTQVLLVSANDPFLERVLALLPNVDLYRLAPDRYQAAEADRFDTIVFDDYLPALLPRGNLLVINPPERGPLPIQGTTTRPTVATWDRANPLLSFVDLTELTVPRASRLAIQPWATALISAADDTPLLLAGEDGGRRLVVLPFELQQSNLPRLPAFPILMVNLLDYLSPPAVVQSPAIQTGSPEPLSPLPQAELVRVVGPTGQTVELHPDQRPIVYSATDAPGLYRVQQIVQDGQQTIGDDLFAANLLDPQESDIRPRLTGLNNPGALDDELTPLQADYWGLLASLILPLLLVEWFWFHHRT